MSGSEVLPATVPAQLSVVVGTVRVAEHSSVIFVSTGVAGAVSSTIVTVALQEALFPLKSVAVKVTVFVPILLQSKLILLAVIAGVSQLSVAVAPVAEITAVKRVLSSLPSNFASTTKSISSP